MAKAKKKHTQIQVSQENNAQIQQVLERYHEIAKNLHASTNQEQAETALAEINDMPEAAQMALLKALSKEQHTDAADVLLAINELSSVKSVRKEARRSLIHLEGVRIYPHWSPPVQPQQAFALQATGNPPRFWKGIVTDSLDVGEVQLLLLFEQGDEYKDVRVLGFLLEFFHDGVKDFFTRVESKRSVDNFIAQMETVMADVETKDCSLAHGRRLLLDALAVNKQFGTQPHRDYRLNVSLVNKLILEVPDLEEDITDFDEDEEDEEEFEDTIDIHDLSPDQVVTTFVESWVEGEYDTAYDLLSSDSPIREGLSRDEWIDRRDAWADEANPEDLEPNFFLEREPQKSVLWLPNLLSASRSATRKEIEVGWSIELDETPLSETLPEMPQATAIYEETDRHWFWTSYTLVKEEDEWRIQSMTDEDEIAQNLSVEELQQRIEKHDKYLDEFAKKHKATEVMQLSEEDAQRFFGEIFQHIMQAAYYTDVLIKKMPLDRTNYEEAAGRLIVFGQYERALVYLEALVERFAEQRGAILRRIAILQRELSKKYFEKLDDERGERFQELAREALHELLDVEESPEARITLAELLIENEEFDEAEDQLLQAKSLVTDPSDVAHIELHLGEIAMEREQYKEALSHYQHVAAHNPASAEAWIDVAEAHKMLENFEEAETSYKRAIELEPDNADYYFTLSKMYTENNQPSKALEIMEDALSANPDSAVLHVYLASMYMESGDYDQAEIFLDKAERIDPELEVTRMFRQMLKLTRPRQKTPIINKLSRPNKKKKRGR